MGKSVERMHLKILVVGAGNIGGYFGGLLMRAGRDITLLVRPGRREFLLRNGLVIEGPRVRRTLLSKPKTILRNEISEAFDLIILCCKAFDLDECIADLSPAVGAKTLILPLLNGIRHIEILDDHFGAKRVLGGFCTLSATRREDGSIVQLNDSQGLTFGQRSGISHERVAAVVEALSDAGFELVQSSNILNEMWEKWVFVTTAAALTALMRAPIGDIMEGGGRTIAETMLDEVASIAAAVGYPLKKFAMMRLRAMLTTAGSLFSASLYREIENGDKIEVEHVIGDLLRRSNAENVLLKSAYVHMKSYEVRRRRELLNDELETGASSNTIT